MKTEFEYRSQSEDDDVRFYPFCWCWPGIRTPFWASIWGGIFIVVGGVWLLTTLELLPRFIADSLGPIAVILIGIAFLINNIAFRK